MVTLHTIDGGTVNAINDALLYDFIIGQNGIASGATVTSEGALLLHIDSGWGVIKGRIFSIEAETVSATPSTSGTVKGRLILQIDITNTTNPITFVTQAAATLPALQQEDINGNGTIFQLAIATYDVNEVAVSNLQMVAPVVEAVKQQIDSARSTALAAQSTADTALNNQKMEVLWENNNPTVDFYQQTVNFNTLSYNFFLVILNKSVSSNGEYVSITMGYNMTCSVTSIVYGKLVERDVNISANSATFTRGLVQNSYEVLTENNSFLIPVKIIGILK